MLQMMLLVPTSYAGNGAVRSALLVEKCEGQGFA
jgi:hypothetical protein